MAGIGVGFSEESHAQLFEAKARLLQPSACPLSRLPSPLPYSTPFQPTHTPRHPMLTPACPVRMLKGEAKYECAVFQRSTLFHPSGLFDVKAFLPQKSIANLAILTNGC